MSMIIDECDDNEPIVSSLSNLVPSPAPLAKKSSSHVKVEVVNITIYPYKLHINCHTFI